MPEEAKVETVEKRAWFYACEVWVHKLNQAYRWSGVVRTDAYGEELFDQVIQVCYEESQKHTPAIVCGRENIHVKALNQIG